jgi:hypothetical protein
MITFFVLVASSMNRSQATPKVDVAHLPAPSLNAPPDDFKFPIADALARPSAPFW